jgi:hypothetical protein
VRGYRAVSHSPRRPVAQRVFNTLVFKTTLRSATCSSYHFLA